MTPPSKKKSAKFQLQDSQHVEIADSPMTSTPTRTEVPLTPSTPSESYSGPMTRSMVKSGSADLLEAVPFRNSSRTLTERLRASAKRPIRPLKLSKLEKAKDLGHAGGDDDDGQGSKSIVGDHDEDSNMVAHEALLSSQVATPLGKRKHPMTGQLRMLSDQPAAAEEQQLVSNDEVTTPAPKRVRKQKYTSSKPLRRSPRFLKPLTEFHKYPDLPNELKIMIWEAAVEARLLYLCNRGSIVHLGAPFGVQNRVPPWFLTCRISVGVALSCYQKRFELTPVPLPFGALSLSPSTIQSVNLDLDIVIFEPCHSGCRGYYCARHQYSDEDRAAVRFLAVQTESPNLIAGSEPCWQSISRSWPNVETLYLMRVAMKGIKTSEKAMIRVAPNDRENELQKFFGEWKKALGKDLALEKLEFVVVVDKETSAMDSKDLYKSVEDRKTGLPEDIIHG
ncbi:hypothetical protein F4821DRAFT_54454 [Hypoxylon rubiginosum]|uniref:Uncharacterized protein n=1 Tax=Hypoxylon rubiginosum TaxID=110542 RepID=A0ACC0CJG5_9PEZI|nr:hypothetical protein F4821DRAFT_54454 [Hypoxylon rubiginosum]